MKIFLGILSGLILIIACVVIYVLLAWDSPHEAPYPDIQAVKDSAVIARGKYLAFGPAHCSTCHVPIDKIMEVENGLQIPLSGGWELEIPPGIFRAPNLTPDPETGIGKLTDGDIARVLRHSVGSDGRFIAPFMPFQELSDDDLTAIISYLRSQPAVKNQVKRTELKFLGKALLTFGLLSPVGPEKDPPKSVAVDSTAEYGAYIANSVANCIGCHTERDMKTGEFIGPDFAGGHIFEPDVFSEGYGFVSPNITPHPETGIMASWSEQTFMHRFRNGRIYRGSPMPWGALSRTDDVELKALYRYIRSLEPVSRKIAKVVYAPGEDLP